MQNLLTTLYTAQPPDSFDIFCIDHKDQLDNDIHLKDDLYLLLYTILNMKKDLSFTSNLYLDDNTLH